LVLFFSGCLVCAYFPAFAIVDNISVFIEGREPGRNGVKEEMGSGLDLSVMTCYRCSHGPSAQN
jgi:hypothetical protein